MKKMISLTLIMGMILSFNGAAFAAGSNDDGSDDSNNSTGSALGSALMGGLLGAGLGAAIGSASGKAGQGAAIGAGIGAIGGTLVGAQAEKTRRQKEDAYYVEEAPQPVVRQSTSQDVKPKKRVIREFDEQGNVISEKQINN